MIHTLGDGWQQPKARLFSRSKWFIFPTIIDNQPFCLHDLCVEVQTEHGNTIWFKPQGTIVNNLGPDCLAGLKALYAQPL